MHGKYIKLKGFQNEKWRKEKVKGKMVISEYVQVAR